MGCGNSSPSEPPEESDRADVSLSTNLKKQQPDKPTPGSPRITLEYYGGPVGNGAETPTVVDITNDNFNNGNDKLSETKTPVSKSDEKCVSNSNGPPTGHEEIPNPLNRSDEDKKVKSEEASVAAYNGMQGLPTDINETKAQLVLASQENFSTAIRFACLLVRPESVIQYANEHVHSLRVPRSLPPSISFIKLLNALPNLQEIDVSENQMGPQAFRTLMLAMAHNSTVSSLNVANNHTDTDSAISIGNMLKKNYTLVSLNVSGNYLGKDFFSRSVGPALASNKTLRILKCAGIGSVDFSCLLENASDSNTITHLTLSHNTVQKTAPCLKHLCSWIQKPDCSLHSLELKSFGMKEEDLVEFSKALSINHSISVLDLSSNEVSSSEALLEFLLNSMLNQQLESLNLDNNKPKQQRGITKDLKMQDGSSLRVLSLVGCAISDAFITSFLHGVSKHGLSKLEELNLSNNEALTTSGLKEILELTKDRERMSRLQRLSFGMNKAEDIAEVLDDIKLTNLMYLNLRKAKMSPTAVGKLSSLTESNCLETVVLDGVKLAGSGAIRELTGSKNCSLIAISLASCLLADADLEPLNEAIKNGLQLHMLKLTANRIQDEGVRRLVDALSNHTTHPLKLIDLQNNQISKSGAEALSDLFTHSSHKSQIHSINISNNTISAEGLAYLVSVLGEGKLTNLVAHKQKASYGEENMEQIFHRLAETLGLSTRPEAHCCDLPKLVPGLTVKLTGLGGFPGDLGRLLDSTAIVTDNQIENRCNLTLSDIMEMSSALKGHDTVDCLLTKDEWNNIIGVDKEAPTWLQLADHRERALYLLHLPAAVTPNKLDGLLNMEADCDVDEVVMMKDEMTRQNNGLAWVLLSKKEHIQQAVNFYNAGEAKVFSQSFILSRVNVRVDDEGSYQAETAAKDEMLRRAAERKSDEAAHRRLIQQSYRESQARHAYRLANPAYADGRIW